MRRNTMLNSSLPCSLNEYGVCQDHTHNGKHYFMLEQYNEKYQTKETT